MMGVQAPSAQLFCDFSRLRLPYRSGAMGVFMAASHEPLSVGPRVFTSQSAANSRQSRKR
jgi:hypothetical protein